MFHAETKKMESLYHELLKVCSPQMFPGLTTFFHAIDDLRKKHRYINIAVLGQFKAGKSSFLNHLTGHDILPVGVTPVTNVVTILQHGRIQKITIHFLDRKIRNIRPEELPEYINEQINTNNHKQVGKVIIELPELAPFQGIRFIDTPGIGSLFKHNTEATFQFTPDTGLAIVAINPDNPLSENDINLIRELRTYTPRIYILLTKTDLYAAKDLEEIEKFIYNTLEQHFQISYTIFRYSVRKNAVAYRNEILSKVIRPMVPRQESIVNEINAYKIRSLARTCLSYLQASRQASLKARRQKKELQELIERNRDNLDRQRRELQLIAQNHTALTHEKLTDILLTYHESLSRLLKIEFTKDYKTWHGNLFVLSRRYEQWMARHLAREIRNIINHTENKWIKLLDNPRKHFETYLENARKERREKIQEVLHTTLREEPVKFSKPEIKKPDISVYWAFDTNIDLLWFLIPMFLFRKAFGRFFLKRIPDETEKNLYRTVSALTEIINREIFRMMDDTMTVLRNDLVTAEKILSSGEDEATVLEKKINKLQKLLGNQQGK